MRPATTVAIILLATFAGAHVELQAGEVEYSTEPLAQSPIMSTAELAVDLARFNNWLVEQKPPEPEQYALIREHDYLLIDSVLKIRKHEGRAAFNEFERVALQKSFSLASGLGVYGAGLVAQELANGGAHRSAEPLLPKEPTQLQLQFPYLVLSSKAASWQVRFPYYFMLWHSSRFTAKNGLLTDLAMLSTSFSKHDKGDGQSQATITFVYSPKADCKVFDRSWLELLGVDASGKTSAVLLPASQNYYAYEPKSNLHTELTLLSDATGCYALAYSGIGGPYQANRVSYLDFVKSLDRTGGTRSDLIQPTTPAAPSSGFSPP